ncbi:MAG: hypothetical protein ACK4VY_06065 [Brevundimonas sp.]
MLAAVVSAMLALNGLQAASQPTSYDAAVRCAGLTQAASELEGGESGEGRALYDAALYWSLTAMQMATEANRPAATAEADQTRARIRAVRELSADNAEARAELNRCRSRTPALG